jgi:hypothetical protein
MAPGDVTEARWAAGVLDARLVAWRSAGRLSGRRLVIAAGLAAASGGLAARDRGSFITRADAGAPCDPADTSRAPRDAGVRNG